MLALTHADVCAIIDTVQTTPIGKELEICGYEVWRGFSISLPVLAHYEPLAKRLLALQNVEGMDTTFDSTDRVAVEAGLMAVACANATRDAQLMAQGFGRELGCVYAISREDMDVAMDLFHTVDYCRKEPAQRELLFVPATIELAQNVRAIFQLLP